MKRADLGDVVVRTRGLARRLLEGEQLRQLARASSSGHLAGALEDLGYWMAPSAGGAALPASRLVERAVEHETLRRLDIVVRWLDDRTALFSPMLELEVCDALRVRLRELSDAVVPARRSVVGALGGWAGLREVRRAAAQASDTRELVRALTRLGSPYAAPLATAMRRQGEDARALEETLGDTWAHRARLAAARSGGPMRCWVEDEIDLGNAWTALAGHAGAFVAGGRALPRLAFEAVAEERDGSSKRRQLVRAFRETGLGLVFEDPDLGMSALEARARAVRIARAHGQARLDPIGEGPIVEFMLRLWSERADLRCIAWGVDARMTTDAIVSQLAPERSRESRARGGLAA